MESILDALFQYAQERRLGPTLPGEYWGLLRRMEVERERLSAPILPLSP